MKNKVLWISWENHKRTLELSQAIKCDLYVINYNTYRLIRYILCLIKTIQTIYYNQPKLLIVQNPSIVLALSCVGLRKLFGFSLIVDAHNAAITPDNIYLRKLYFIYKYVHKKADITLVTNKYLASKIEENKGFPLILPDKIPDIRYDNLQLKKLTGTQNFLFICTFALDEPYFEVLEAAKNIDQDICIYITGNYRKAKKLDLRNLSSNIYLEGFLPEREYWELLLASDFVIDLTYRNDCLVCGAYEALAGKKPLILSDTRVNRDYFYKGVVYTENLSDSISEAINYSIANKIKLKKNIIELRKELSQAWIANLSDLEKNLSLYV